MTERPILFSGPMVRAIITGHKTVTRRLITVPWGKKGRALPFPPYYDGGDGTLHVADEYGDWHDFAKHVRCPYGRTGDRLWVRETWKIGAWRHPNRMAIDYAAGPVGTTPWLEPPDAVYAELSRQSLIECHRAVEREDPNVRDEGSEYRWEVGNSPCRWRPSIHMPRWASRLTLEVTGTRVERLQTITEDGARAEGVWSEDVMESSAYRSSFASLWDEINGARPGASWEADPWVWVVDFRRVEVAP